MPKKQYTPKSTPRTTRRFGRHVDFKLIEVTPQRINDFCPDWCRKETTQRLIKRTARATRRGSTWGVKLKVIYQCMECGHVYVSAAWRKNLQQMSFFDMAKAENEK